MPRYRNAVVLRNARRIAPYTLGPRSRMAFQAASYVYRNRRGVKRAVRTIGRAYRAYKKRKSMFSPKHIGEPVGTSNCKRTVQLNTALTAKDTRTQYIQNVTEIDHTTTNEIEKRQRQMVNLRGIKICVAVKNDLTVPLYFNWALLALKCGAGSVPNTGDFFRASQADRSKGFSTALNALEFHCLPINTDKYIILRHKRFRLAANGGTAYTDGTGKSYMNFDFYQKIGRQIRYNNLASVDPGAGDVYVVYWADGFNGAASDLATPNAFDISQRYITYWREPKN